MRKPPSDFSGPANNAYVVTPTDDLAIPRTRGLWIGVTGDVTVNMYGEGTEVLFAAIPAGTLLPISVTCVHDTGTDADDIVALY